MTTSKLTPKQWRTGELTKSNLMAVTLLWKITPEVWSVSWNEKLHFYGASNRFLSILFFKNSEKMTKELFLI